jgi:hypothetical protein
MGVPAHDPMTQSDQGHPKAEARRLARLSRAAAGPSLLCKVHRIFHPLLGHQQRDIIMQMHDSNPSALISSGPAPRMTHLPVRPARKPRSRLERLETIGLK